MKRSAFIVMLFVATAGLAQPDTAPTPRIGPTEPPARADLWQRLTPQQREQLWRSMSPEQKSDLWRSLEPQERRAMRERLGPPQGGDSGRPGGMRRQFEGGEAPPRTTMSPEERRQFREQIREAHRLRHERMQAERGAIRAGP